MVQTRRKRAEEGKSADGAAPALTLPPPTRRRKRKLALPDDDQIVDGDSTIDESIIIAEKTFNRSSTDRSEAAPKVDEAKLNGNDKKNGKIRVGNEGTKVVDNHALSDEQLLMEDTFEFLDDLQEIDAVADESGKQSTTRRAEKVMEKQRQDEDVAEKEEEIDELEDRAEISADANKEVRDDNVEMECLSEADVEGQMRLSEFVETDAMDEEDDDDEEPAEIPLPATCALQVEPDSVADNEANDYMEMEVVEPEPPAISDEEAEKMRNREKLKLELIRLTKEISMNKTLMAPAPAPKPPPPPKPPQQQRRLVHAFSVIPQYAMAPEEPPPERVELTAITLPPMPPPPPPATPSTSTSPLTVTPSKSVTSSQELFASPALCSPSKSRMSMLGGQTSNVPPPAVVVLPKLSSSAEKSPQAQPPQPELQLKQQQLQQKITNRLAEKCEKIQKQVKLREELSGTKEGLKANGRVSESVAADEKADNRENREAERRKEEREKRHRERKDQEDKERKRKSSKHEKKKEEKDKDKEKDDVKKKDSEQEEKRKVDKVDPKTIPIPSFEVIDENIYLTKNALKKKTESLLCGCRQSKKGADCSGESCVNAAVYVECPGRCGCNNRRFMKKQYASVEAFHTGTSKGFGLRAVEEVRKGQFIIEYVGEVLEKDDYEQRKKAYSADKDHQHHYLCETGTYTIDATKKGSISRFINHSCEPNAICEKWAVPKTPGDIARIGFFAKRNITSGEEITFDYQFVSYGREAQKCFCGTASCSGWIGTLRDYDDSDSDSDDDEEEAEEKTAEDELAEEMNALDVVDRTEYINSRLGDLNIKNKLHSRRVVQLVSYMMDYDQRVSLIDELFSVDSNLKVQMMYAREGMTTIFARWLTDNDFCVASLKLKQRILKALHGDAFIEPARGDRELLTLVNNLATCAEIPDAVDVQCVVESMVSHTCDVLGEYDDSDKDVTSEIYTNFERFRVMAARLNHYWFNRSVSFRIPKKVRQPEKGEEKEKGEKNDKSSPVEADEEEDRWRNPRNFRHVNYFQRRRFQPYYHNNYRFERKRRSRSRSRSASPKRRRAPDAIERPTPSSSSSSGDNKPIHVPPPPATKNGNLQHAPRSTLTINLSQPPAYPNNDGMYPPYPPMMPGYGPGYDWNYPYYHTMTYPPMYQTHPMMHPPYMPRMEAPPPPPAPAENPAVSTAPKDPPSYDMKSFLALDVIEQIYDKATAEELRVRLDDLQKEVHLAHKKLALKETAVKETPVVVKTESVELPTACPQAATPRKPHTPPISEKEEKVESSQPPPPPTRYNWARVKTANGETYFYDKFTKEVQWDPPRPEQGELDPNDRSPPPVCDTTIDHDETSDEHMSTSTSLSARVVQLLAHDESLGGVTAQEEEDAERERAMKRVAELESSRRKEKAYKEFKESLERIIKPIVRKSLDGHPEATASKIVWLIKLMVREMYKRESSRSDFNYRLGDTSAKMVKKYTESFLERKMRNGTDDLWKGYK